MRKVLVLLAIIATAQQAAYGWAEKKVEKDGYVTYTCRGTNPFSGRFNLVRDATPLDPSLRATFFGSATVQDPVDHMNNGLLAISAGRSRNPSDRSVHLCLVWAAAKSPEKALLSSSFQGEDCALSIPEGKVLHMYSYGNDVVLDCDAVIHLPFEVRN